MNQGLSQNIWINVIGFQVTWWLSIMYGNSAIVPVVFLLALHLVFHKAAVEEIAVITACACIGFTVDIMLTMQGVFIFENNPAHVPCWLFLLWLCFSATLRQSLRFFSHHLALASIAGAIAGSLTYLAAARLGAVSFGFSTFSTLSLLALVWAILFPLLLLISTNIRKMYAY